eukprot:gene29364-29234_t
MLVVTSLLSLCTAAAASGSGLTLAMYNNTGFGGAPYSNSTIPSFDFVLSGCDFGRATVATLHIDDHLVCQLGGNVGSGCGAPGDPKPCSGIAGDNPLPTMTRTSLPVRR